MLRKWLLLVALQRKRVVKYALLALALFLTILWIAPVEFRMTKSRASNDFGPYDTAASAAADLLHHQCPPDFPLSFNNANGPFRCNAALNCIDSQGWPAKAQGLLKFCRKELVAYIHEVPETAEDCQLNATWQHKKGARSDPLWVQMKAEAVLVSKAEAEALRAIGAKPRDITWSGQDKALQNAGYIEARHYVGSSWVISGWRQFQAAQKFMDILPKHHFLEIGCGALNAGQFFIDYFDTDRYVCVEPNEVLHKQSAAATPWIGKNITSKRAHFVTRDDFDPRPAMGQAVHFDRMWSHSVLSHAADWQLMQYFEVVAAVLVPKTGIAMASIRFSDFNGNAEMPSHYSGWVYPSVSYFSFSEIRCMARKVGLELTLVPETRLFMTEIVPGEFHDWVRMQRI